MIGWWGWKNKLKGLTKGKNRKNEMVEFPTKTWLRGSKQDTTANKCQQ